VPISRLWRMPSGVLRCVQVCLCVDSGGRSVALCRSMKRAYQSAVENAFSRLLLVVLDNGKVFVEDMIDSSADSHQFDSQILQVPYCMLVSNSLTVLSHSFFCTS